MCGIFGYCNFHKEKSAREITDILTNGLQRLEYRGYDSAGLAVLQGSAYKSFKKKGKVQTLIEHINSTGLEDNKYACHAGIAHTRWATHGEPSETNCHPISSQENEFMVVHNGIINNWKPLRDSLEKHGYTFRSATDTECIAQLILFVHRKSTSRKMRLSFVEIVNEAVHKLEGAFAFLVVSKYFPGEAVAARRGSPLLVGVSGPSVVEMDCVAVDSQCPAPRVSLDTPLGTPKSSSVLNLSQSVSRVFVRGSAEEHALEVFFSSDAAAIIEHTSKIITLEDGDLAHVSERGLEIQRNLPGGAPVRPLKKVIGDIGDIAKGTYPHFMLKEIHEQKETVENTMRGRVRDKGEIVLGGIKPYLSSIREARNILLIACGTSYYACLHMRGLLEELAQVPVLVEVASDFNDRHVPLGRADCCVFVSQSGETADSLIALKYVRERGALTIGVTNVVGSTISRSTDCGIHINAGSEIGVASTKAYTSQSVALAMLALQLGEGRKETESRRAQIAKDLKKISEGISAVLEDELGLKQIAEKYLIGQQSILLLGRGYQLATALEGALKLKEVTYIHCEGIGAGELKHGPLALVDDKLRLIMILTETAQGKSQNAYEQVRSRGGKPIVICTPTTSPLFGDSLRIVVPEVSDCLQGIINVVVLQLLSYYTAVGLGVNVDQPRNLAKSVTVE